MKCPNFVDEQRTGTTAQCFGAIVPFEPSSIERIDYCESGRHRLCLLYRQASRSSLARPYRAGNPKSHTRQPIPSNMVNEARIIVEADDLIFGQIVGLRPSCGLGNHRHDRWVGENRNRNNGAITTSQGPSPAPYLSSSMARQPSDDPFSLNHPCMPMTFRAAERSKPLPFLSRRMSYAICRMLS